MEGRDSARSLPRHFILEMAESLRSMMLSRIAIADVISHLMTVEDHVTRYTNPEFRILDRRILLVMLAAGMGLLLSCVWFPGVMDQARSDAAKAMPQQGYILSFHDEFDGYVLDKSKWFTDPHLREDRSRQYIINNERQAYVEDALKVRGGLLRISVERKEAAYAGQVMEYTSGCISTRFGGFGQKYGYFEIRCRMPRTRGLWPAFWLMPEHGNRVGSIGAEVDVFEFWARLQQSKYSVAIHWDGYDDEHKMTKRGIRVSRPWDEFHTYAAELTPYAVIFYCDGKAVARHTGGGVTHDTMNLIVNCAVEESGADRKRLPDVFEVDYVRVYRKADGYGMNGE